MSSQPCGACLEPGRRIPGKLREKPGILTIVIIPCCLEDRPTAIFAASDQMAYGVLATAEEYGLRVPEDLSLIGFDDIPLSAHTRPALTSVRQPFYEMGQRAIALLLSLLESPRPLSNGRYPGSLQTYAFLPPVKQSEPIRLQLAADLVVRASCSTPQALSVPAPE